MTTRLKCDNVFPNDPLPIVCRSGDADYLTTAADKRCHNVHHRRKDIHSLAPKGFSCQGIDYKTVYDYNSQK